MQQELRDLMDVLAIGLVLDEGLARDLAETAREMDADGRTMVADIYFALSRQHRVKSIEARAQLKLLSVQFDDIIIIGSASARQHR